MPGVARDGDRAKCGAVISASDTVVTADGKKVVRVGDEVFHLEAPFFKGAVLEGSSKVNADGKAVARIGDRVSCPLHFFSEVGEGSSKVFAD